MKSIFLTLFFLSLGTTAHAADSFSCENSFRQWMPAGDHQALHNSAYGIEYQKLGSVFITQKDGLPYYSPVWKLGVFTEAYPAIILEEGGTLQPEAGTMGYLKKGEVLYLAGQTVNANEVRLKLLTKNKFSVKANDPKPTDRVSLEFVIPKGSGWCNAQRNFQAWLRGFGGSLEAERYQQIGDQPPPPGVPPPALEKKSKATKETKQTLEKEEKVKVSEEPPASPEPVPAPAAKKGSASSPPPADTADTSAPKKLLEPTDINNLYPPKETDLKSGMTRSEVDAKLGKPVNEVKMGDKSLVYYEDVMVEFVKNRLSDIHISDRPSPSVLKRYH